MDLLGRNGYKPRLEADLTGALKAVEERVPRLVLLDLELRGEPGLQLWERLRTDPRTRNVPVVLTSGHDPEKELERLPLVKGWLKKPFPSRRLLDTLAAASEGSETP